MDFALDHIALGSTQMRLIVSCLGSSVGALDRSICLLDRTARYSLSLFPPLNRNIMSMTYSTLRHQKLTKTLEKDTAKSLTNIS